MAQKNNNGLSTPISNGLEAYSTWRFDLTEAIIAWRKWLLKDALLDSSLESQFNDVIKCISDESLNIAFISEYSRGKTELINAIFFGDSNHTILPSGAGRTTMCPTEIFYDSDMPLGVQLLPVETLNNKSPLDELKLNSELWIQLPFKKLNNQHANEALKELSKTIRVPPEIAKDLGFTFNEKTQSGESTLVEIPKWRHALVNIKHPLLENNLVIHDTPGFNALGIEARLTVETLANVHSTVFVLDASTGATKSDKHIWDRHISKNASNNGANIVALNKLDALWTSRTNASNLREQLKKIISSTASALKVDNEKILSVSAHNALVGKLENKPALIEKSRIAKLELAIAENLIPAKKKVVLTKIFPLAQDIAKSIDDSLTQRIEELRSNEASTLKKQELNNTVKSRAQSGIELDKATLQQKIHCSRIMKTHLDEHVKQINNLISDEFIENSIKTFQEKIRKSTATLDFREKVAEYLLLNYKQLNLASTKALEANSSYIKNHRELNPDLDDESLLELSLTRHLDWLTSIETKYKRIERKPGLGPKKQAQRINKLFEGVSLATGRALRRARNETNNWYQIILSPYENNIKHQTQIIKRRINHIKQIDQKIKNDVAVSGHASAKLTELIKKKRQLYALVHNVNSHLIQHDYSASDSVEAYFTDPKSNVVDIR